MNFHKNSINNKNSKEFLKNNNYNLGGFSRHLPPDNKVINLSNFSFPPSVFSLLGKGLNFALAPRKIPVEDIICDVEFGIKNLPDKTKDMIRKDCAVALRRAKSPRSNISKAEFEALKTLNQNRDVVVLKMDKGGAAVILDREDYRNKMLDHLCNSGSYKKISKNPLKRVSRVVSLAIKSCNSTNPLSQKLIEGNPITPRIYGFP